MIKCKYSVYLLKSTVSNRTYIGYTNKAVELRLRKHNGELQGGAKRTSRHRPWEIVLYVTGFEYERTALQYEFVAQHPPKTLKSKLRNTQVTKSKKSTNKTQKTRFSSSGIRNKIKILKSLLKQERICSTAPLNSELKLAVFFMKPEALEIWNSC